MSIGITTVLDTSSHCPMRLLEFVRVSAVLRGQYRQGTCCGPPPSGLCDDDGGHLTSVTCHTRVLVQSFVPGTCRPGRGGESGAQVPSRI